MVRQAPAPAARHERLELPDGDFLDLNWVGGNTGPLVLVLHGLNGDIQSPYAKGILNVIEKCGWRGVFMHFRGCSGVPNRLARGYHSGETGDLQFVVEELRRREPNVSLAAVGFSLGGNVLLKWLGENKQRGFLQAAVAISVPFELHACANRLNSGVSRFYQWWLLRELRSILKMKFQDREDVPIDLQKLPELKSFWSFDNHVTAPLHGFDDAEDYYRRASSRPYLRDIYVPTLILHSRDDPFNTPQAIPEQSELSPHVLLEIYDQGGHVGFIAGDFPWRPVYWLEERILSYLQDYLSINQATL